MKSFQLPSDDFWHKMLIFPEKIRGSDNPTLVQETIIKFPINQLRKFFNLVTGKDIKADREDLAFIIASQQEFSDLARCLYILEQTLSLVTAPILEKIAEKEKISIPKSKRGAAIEIFTHKKELLAVARILSLSSRRFKRTHYRLESIEPDFNIHDYVESLSKEIEEEVSFPEKRAKLDEPIVEENNILLSIKFEKTKRKVEEFDSWHYDKPAGWVILELNPQNNVLSLKGEKNVFAHTVVNVTSKVITGKDAPLEEIITPEIPSIDPDIDESINHIIETQETFNEDDFKITGKKWKRVIYEDTPLAGNPTVIIEGEGISEAINELKVNHNLDLTKYDPAGFSLELTYQYQGLEKTVIWEQSVGKTPRLKIEGSVSQNEEILVQKYLTEISNRVKPSQS
ncbi:MAG: hypothetical protein ACFE9L_21090 [Candidatus Hodarchaeota archaeon]